MKTATLSILVLLLSFHSFSAKITSKQSGDFFSPSTWNGGVVPTAADEVVISNSHSITMELTGDYTLDNIQMKYGSSLQVTTTDPSYTLIVTNSIDISNGDINVVFETNTQTGTILFSGGSNSIIDIASGYLLYANADLEMKSGPHEVSVHGTLSVENVALTGGDNRLNIYPGGQVFVRSNISVTGSTGLNVNNNGTLSVGGDVNMSGGSMLDVDGTMAVDGDFNLSNGSVEVDGLLTVEGTLDLNHNFISGTGVIDANTIDCSSGDCDPQIMPGILPIELKYFTAARVSNYIDLSWVTTSEEDNDFFSIERSYDAENFHAIAVVPGAGTSYEEHSYNHRDYFVQHDVPVYYRLKQTDYDGKFSYSNVVVIQPKTEISGFPNVDISWDTDVIKIRFVDLSKDITAYLYTISGQIVSSWSMPTAEGGQTITLGMMDSEVYYILELKANGQIKVEKIKK